MTQPCLMEKRIAQLELELEAMRFEINKMSNANKEVIDTREIKPFNIEVSADEAWGLFSDLQKANKMICDMEKSFNNSEQP